MSTRYDQKLAHMAEQIVANLTISEDTQATADKAADHIDRFWGPGMREDLVAWAQTPGAEMSDVLRLVIDRIAVALSTE